MFSCEILLVANEIRMFSLRSTGGSLEIPGSALWIPAHVSLLNFTAQLSVTLKNMWSINSPILVFLKVSADRLALFLANHHHGLRTTVAYGSLWTHHISAAAGRFSAEALNG